MRLIEQACSQELSKSSLEIIKKVVDEVNSKPSLPKEAIKLIRKKLIDENIKVKFLGLLVLEACMDKCGYPFHQLVATKDFMNVLMQLLQENSQSSQVSNSI